MKQTKDYRILVVIPALNEAGLIASVVEAAVRYLSVLVVDDGSIDDTAALAARAGATVIRHGRNKGKGSALRTGFAWAMDRDYAAVITMDADGQHDPAEIPKFISAYRENGAHLTIGRRDFREIPFPRNVSNRIGSRLLSMALGQTVHDASCGYRLYTRNLLQHVDLESKAFDLEAEAIGKALTHEMDVGWVAIRTLYDSARKSHYRGHRDVPHFLRIIWKTYRWRKKGGIAMAGSD